MKSGWGRGGKDCTNKFAMEHFQREMRALDMRIAGEDYQTIAEELGYSHAGSARRVVLKAMRIIRTDKVKHVRLFELARLDKLLGAAWERAMEGHLGAIQTVLKVMQQRAKLLGLDAPLKVAKTDVKGRDIVTMSDEERAKRIEQLLAEAQHKREKERVQEAVGVGYGFGDN